MNTQTSPSPDETQVRALYQQLLDAWNRRDADGYAGLFAEDGHAIGFDGSQHNGQVQIATEIGQLFAHHQTGKYVGKVREAHVVTPDVVILYAVAGIVPHGQTDINPAINALQTLVAAKNGGHWRIAMLQNTPAQFHGRPELAQQLTEELQQLLT